MAQSAVECIEDKDLTEMTRDAFIKIADYLNGELEGTFNVQYLVWNIQIL